MTCVAEVRRLGGTFGADAFGQSMAVDATGGDVFGSALANDVFGLQADLSADETRGFVASSIRGDGMPSPQPGVAGFAELSQDTVAAGLKATFAGEVLVLRGRPTLDADDVLNRASPDRNATPQLIHEMSEKMSSVKKALMVDTVSGSSVEIV